MVFSADEFAREADLAADRWGDPVASMLRYASQVCERLEREAIRQAHLGPAAASSRETLSVADASRVVGVTRQTIMRWMDEGRIECAPLIGKQQRLYRDSLPSPRSVAVGT